MSATGSITGGRAFPDAHSADRENAHYLHALLPERLEAAFRTIERKRVLVAFHAGGRSTLTGVSSEPEVDASPMEWTFPAGCLTKLFTGALMSRAVDKGRVRLDDRVALHLEGVDHVETLDGATIKDLLDHTHGLDDSAIERAPLDDKGRIDASALLAAVRPHRLARPGEIYSYSNVGAWMMAAVLERLHDEPFAAQLRRDLLEPLGVRVRSASASPLPAQPAGVCPAMGASLTVSVSEMLAFLKSEALARPDLWPPGLPDTEISPLPGWNALESGVFRGWKHHGGYWFGHNSVWPNASAMVRVQPQAGIAIVVASTHHAAPVVAAKLFADVLPEYKRLSFPKPLCADAVSRLSPERYRGRYNSAADVLVVENAHGPGKLRLVGPGIDSALIPAAEETFYVQPASQTFSFVQFLYRDEARARYLWDGRRVYVRCD